MYNWTERRLSVEFQRRLEQLGDDENPYFGGDVNLNGYATYAIFNAAVDMDKNTLCFMNGVGKMAKTDASTEALSDTLLGVSADAYSADEEGFFYLFGVIPLSGFSPGSVLFASIDAGLMQDDPPLGSGDIIRITGYGLPDGKVYFNPDRAWAQLETDDIGELVTFRNDDNITFRSGEVVEFRG